MAFAEGFAQHLPQNDGTMDCLGCVDALDTDDCSIEAWRVLKENNGPLYFGEYDSSSSYNDILRMFHDQSIKRK